MNREVTALLTQVERTLGDTEGKRKLLESALELAFQLGVRSGYKEATDDLRGPIPTSVAKQ